jgi:glycosyltransferase involved in cell wall biosynthesis
VFDNSGRTAQLHAARRCGARVIYISSRWRPRFKAFRPIWMRAIDEHWIAYPRFIAGDLTIVERLKLKVLHRPKVRFLDVILARRAQPAKCGGAPPQSVLGRLECAAGRYTLVVPGGGTNHPGAGDAVREFREAAQSLAAGGEVTVFVGGPPPAAADAGSEPVAPCGAAQPGLKVTGTLPQSDLAELMAGARLVITNGGATLLQAIACGRACVAAPIAGDQAERIRRCSQAGAAVASELDAKAIAAAAGALLRDESARASLAGGAARLGLTDGIDTAVRALGALLDLH